MEKFVLENGMIVMFVHRPLKTLYASFCLNVGFSCELRNERGISHMLEHLVISDRKLQLRLDSGGSVLYGEVYKERTFYNMKVLPELFLGTLDAFLDALFSLRLSSASIEKEREIIRDEISMVLSDDDERLSGEYLDKIFFGDHPYANSPLDDLANLDNIEFGSLSAFYRNWYQPRNLVAAFVGDISDSFKSQAISRLEGMRNCGGAALPIPKFEKPASDRAEIRVYPTKSSRLFVVLGFDGFSFADENSYMGRLLTLILTGGYNSVLFGEIRERENLVYYIDSYTLEFFQGGCFCVAFSADPRNLVKIMGKIMALLKILKEEGLPEKDLDRAKKMMSLDLISRYDNNEDISDYYVSEYLYNDTYFDKAAFAAKLDGITPEKIRAEAGRIFDGGRMKLVVVGGVDEEGRSELEERLAAICKL